MSYENARARARTPRFRTATHPPNPQPATLGTPGMPRHYFTTSPHSPAFAPSNPAGKEKRRQLKNKEKKKIKSANEGRKRIDRIDWDQGLYLIQLSYTPILANARATRVSAPRSGEPIDPRLARIFIHIVYLETPPKGKLLTRVIGSFMLISRNPSVRLTSCPFFCLTYSLSFCFVPLSPSVFNSLNLLSSLACLGNPFFFPFFSFSRLFLFVLFYV